MTHTALSNASCWVCLQGDNGSEHLYITGRNISDQLVELSKISEPRLTAYESYDVFRAT